MWAATGRGVAAAAAVLACCYLMQKTQPVLVTTIEIATVPPAAAGS